MSNVQTAPKKEFHVRIIEKADGYVACDYIENTCSSKEDIFRLWSFKRPKAKYKYIIKEVSVGTLKKQDAHLMEQLDRALAGVHPFLIGKGGFQSILANKAAEMEARKRN